MDDRDKRIGDLDRAMQKRLDSMTEQEREEVRTFLRRFDEQVDAKIEQLLYETQAPGSLSEEALEMRGRLRDGQVPLLDDEGKRIYKPRSELTLQDTARFGAFMDAEVERYKREIFADRGHQVDDVDVAEESEN